ncbi:hypothetical protein N008_12865 [Hymenobacter sp. APR13]|nr:hypothetical protein N008_12865 [Hymenobacter sp. APR13]
MMGLVPLRYIQNGCMAEPVSLLLRAEPPRWVKAVHYTGIFLLGAFAMAAFGARVMGERAATTGTRGLSGPLQALLWAAGAASAAWLLVVALLYLLKAARVIRWGRGRRRAPSN